MRTAVLALAGIAVALSAAADPAPVRRTLAECVGIALVLQPTLHSASATVVAGRERVWQATAAYLPQVSANYSATRRHASPSSVTSSAIGGRARTFNFYSTGVALSQVLFDFGQNLAFIHAAQANADSLVADQRTQQSTVVFNVEQAYLALLAAYRLEAVANDTLAQSQKHLDVAQGRFDVGFAPRFDVTQAQVQVANAELNQLTATNGVALGRETLRNAMGLNDPLDFDVVDQLDEPARAVDDDEALASAQEHRPELQSLQAQQRQVDQQNSAIQKDYLPKVTGSGTYLYSGTRYPLVDSWNFGAAVNWSIFNGGLTTAQIGEARANRQKLEFDETALRQSITLEVRQSVLNVHQAVQAIRVANTGLQQARENVALAEGRYATGVGSIIELTDAQASLTGAEASRVQALVNHRTALAALERATADPGVSGLHDGTTEGAQQDARLASERGVRAGASVR